MRCLTPKQYEKHFVRCLGWFDDADYMYIAMEYVEHGNLQKYIRNPPPEVEAAAIVAQVARALQYMHQKGFVHRDLKPMVRRPLLVRPC